MSPPITADSYWWSWMGERKYYKIFHVTVAICHLLLSSRNEIFEVINISVADVTFVKIYCTLKYHDG